jgi:hypothetical protein
MAQVLVLVLIRQSARALGHCNEMKWKKIFFLVQVLPSWVRCRPPSWLLRGRRGHAEDHLRCGDQRRCLCCIVRRVEQIVDDLGGSGRRFSARRQCWLQCRGRRWRQSWRPSPAEASSSQHELRMGRLLCVHLLQAFPSPSYIMVRGSRFEARGSRRARVRAPGRPPYSYDLPRSLPRRLRVLKSYHALAGVAADVVQ